MHFKSSSRPWEDTFEKIIENLGKTFGRLLKTFKPVMWTRKIALELKICRQIF